MSLFKKKEGSPVATEETILSALTGVMDPELGRDLVSLSMIRNVAVSGGDVFLDLVLTTPACPKKAEMQEAVEKAVLSVPGVSSVDVRVSADVKAAKDPMEGRRPVEGVRNIVAVASGKGGVGKSTVSANIAVALHKAGARVGLLDADIYGPSVPTLLNLTKHQLMGENGMILPADAGGLKVLSIGFMLEEDSPVIWRGPMLKKAVRMFEKVGVPILGVIENMSYFLCPHCDGRSEIFGHGGAAETCKQMGLAFLGEIPLQTTLREACDAGVPIVARDPESPAAIAISRAASAAAAALAVLSQV